MKRIFLFLCLLFLIMCFSYNTAQAVTFQLGDVFAASYGKVLHYDKNLNLLEILSTGQSGFETGMAFDSDGNLYVTNFSASNISKFDNEGNLLNSNFVSCDPGAHCESIVFDKIGNFYVGQADGTRDILKFAADGALLGRFDVSIDKRGSDWIDLAANQKIIYYTSEGRKIKRYDVSTNAQLSDFATLPGTGFAYALRLLSDGGLLVADYNDIKRLDNAGNVIKTYDVDYKNGWFALNLDPDGTSFWSATESGFIAKFDIDTGNLLASINAGQNIWGLAVYGEITQGGGGGNQPVPEPSTLLLVGFSLIGLAGFKRFKKIK